MLEQLFALFGGCFQLANALLLIGGVALQLLEILVGQRVALEAEQVFQLLGQLKLALQDSLQLRDNLGNLADLHR